MTWQLFGNLAAGNQPTTLFDTLSSQIAKCVVIPCTAAGTNAITLTGTTNAPLITQLTDLVQFSFIAVGTSTGAVTMEFATLGPPLNAYFSDGITQVGAGGIVTGQPYTFMFSQALNGGLGGFYLAQPVQRQSGTAPTRQVLATPGSGTYTTPGGARQLYIRMWGGGGGGGSNSVAGGAGGNAGATQFNGATFTANGGTGGTAGAGGSGGAGGAGGSGGSGSVSVRLGGCSGGAGFGATLPAATQINGQGGVGGSGPFGGGGFFGGGMVNTGSGGNGAGVTIGPSATASTGGGGGAGEYVELIINTPVASYAYTVGAAGTAAAGANAGAAGMIIVEERY